MIIYHLRISSLFLKDLKKDTLDSLSAKNRGATKNPVSDLELNLSKTATKAIKFYKIKF